MQLSASDPVEEPPLIHIPEDVAALFLWANLKDATYRDFSASRRKLRAQRGQPIHPPAPSEQAEPSAYPAHGAPVEASLPPGEEAEGQSGPNIESRSTEPLPADPLREPPPGHRRRTMIFSTVPHVFAHQPDVRSLSAFDPASEPASKPLAPTPEPNPRIQSSIPQPLSPDNTRSPFHPRWSALHTPHPTVRQKPPPPPADTTNILAVFAPTAGAGKTVLVATLGRALSSMEEHVALAETGPGSPLSAHFASAHFALDSLPPEAVRVVCPTTGSPITLLSCDVDAAVGHSDRQTLLAQNLLSRCANLDRLLVDLTERAGWFLRHLIRPNLTVLIPVTPTMSSVISLLAVERFFRDLTGPDVNPIEPYYLVVQFDEALPVHRDVRDFLSRRVGNRLLPIVIRSAAGVPQAFANGMTVVDYAPNSPIAADYLAVAHWLRNLSPPAPHPAAPRPRHISRWTAL